MMQTENILISVQHNYVLSMLDGSKTVEVRRRPLRIRPGTRVWVYSKLPRGHVELVATVERIAIGSPKDLWDSYRSRIGITFVEFGAYLSGVSIACAILLKDIKPLSPALELRTLRRTARNFHPPQFFTRFRHASTLHDLLVSKLRG
jgi:predicted transcriptional regulator